MLPTSQPGKYARLERERRFLLAELPAGLTRDAPHTTIEDRYLVHSRFRLRRMVDFGSGAITYKLTQKFTPPGGTFASTVITNTYLTPQEYALFVTLPGHLLYKDRYRYVVDGYAYAIDVFRGQLEGLVLAEIEFTTDAALQAFERPSFAVAEVTEQEAFTGGALCQCSLAELGEALARAQGRNA